MPREVKVSPLTTSVARALTAHLCAAIFLIAFPSPLLAIGGDCVIARAVLAAVANNNNRYDVLGRDAPNLPTFHEEGLYGSSKTVPLGRHSDYWRLGWDGERPSEHLIAKWYAVPYRSISVCFERHGSSLLLKDVLGPKMRQPAKRKPLSEIRMSYPALDSPKSEALVLYEIAFTSGIGGHLDLVFLRRIGGEWRRVGSRELAQY